MAELADCILWQGCIDREGYPKAHGGLAHRLAYTRVHGPIPDGMQIDHVCHSRDLTCKGGVSCLHRRCVNPDHLEPVTPLENARRSEKARKTHCIHGHEFTSKNTYVRNGHRQCRACNAAAARKYAAKRRGVS